MKRILLVGLIVAALSLTAGFAVPAFAHDPAEGDVATSDQETWQAMHEACEEGDWQAMDEAADEVHQNLGYAPCHDEYLDSEADDSPNSWGGMMGGWGSMMRW